MPPRPIGLSYGSGCGVPRIIIVVFIFYLQIAIEVDIFVVICFLHTDNLIFRIFYGVVCDAGAVHCLGGDGPRRVGSIIIIIGARRVRPISAGANTGPRSDSWVKTEQARHAGTIGFNIIGDAGAVP